MSFKRIKTGPSYLEQNNLDNLYEQPYYFDDLTIDKASEILTDIRKEGAFLIRRRISGYSPAIPYALSVYYDNKVHHTRIKCDNNGNYTTESRDQNPKKFYSIPKLIDYFNQEASLKLTTRYSDLVGCYKCCNLSIDTVSINEMSDYENLKYLPYYLGNINKEEIENILMDIKQNEVFFIRKTSLRNFLELAVYFRSCVYFLKISRINGLYMIETLDQKFETINEMIRYYNYNKLRMSNGLSAKLQIYSKYINL